MKILFAVWEMDPFFKFGGLGDVARSLPGALKDLGVDIRVVLPFYKAMKLGKCKKRKVGRGMITFDNRQAEFEIYHVIHPATGVDVYLIHNAFYLDAGKSAEMFAFFDKAVTEMIASNLINWVPEVIHCNDHHTGYIPILVKENQLAIKTILTIHNLSYQGVSPTTVLDKLGLSHDKSNLLRWEISERQINALMEGIIHADVITTVSPTYAREIMTEKYGMGLDEYLRGKEGRVFGILNGINMSSHYIVHKGHKTCIFTQMHQTHAYNVEACVKDKKLSKIRLQRLLKLKVNENLPLTCFIGRFDPGQKGLDILHKMLRRLDLDKHQFIILGSGNRDWEERYEWLDKFYPKNVKCIFRFDEVLAHKIYEASDFILIPSRFEPCGLIQMISMYFGTLPIARRTGGLIDSIKDHHNGFLFDEYTSESMEMAFNKAIEIWSQDKCRYQAMMLEALRSDFTWERSAREYLNLYEKLVNNTI